MFPLCFPTSFEGAIIGERGLGTFTKNGNMSDMIVIDYVGVSVGLRCVPDSCGSLDFALASDAVADDDKKEGPQTRPYGDSCDGGDAPVAVYAVAPKMGGAV